MRADKIAELRTELGLQASNGRDAALREFLARVDDMRARGLGLGAETTFSAADTERYLAAYDRLFEAHDLYDVAVTADDYANKAWLLVLLNRYADANATNAMALQLDPAHPVALENRASLCCTTGEYEEGLALIKRMLAGAPRDKSSAKWFHYRGQIALARGHYQAAIDDLSEALELDPGYTISRMLRASALLGLGRRDESLADLDEALRIAPRDVNCITLRAIIRKDTGNVAGALEDVKAGLKLAPDSALLWATSGDARRLNGDAIGAFADTERAVELAPDQYLGWLNRGAALAALGRREEARASFDRAAEVAMPSQRDAILRHRRAHLGE